MKKHGHGDILILIHLHTTHLLAKKGTTLQNKQPPLNFERIKRLIKQKTRKILPGSHCLIQQDSGKTLKEKQTQKTSSRKFPAQHRSRLSRSTSPLHQNLQL